MRLFSPCIDKPPLKSADKILLYAPGTDDGREHMSQLLSKLYNVSCASETPWILMPMLTSKANDLTSSNLGDKLKDALQRVRSQKKQNNAMDKSSVVFLGMDSPEIPLNEVARGLQQYSSKALICPSADGGYGMLSLPASAPISVFDGVLWSHPLTAVSQMKALTDHNVQVVVGTLMRDIDEADDVHNLIKRLKQREESGEGDCFSLGVLGKLSLDLCQGDENLDKAEDDEDVIISPCKHSLETLTKMGLYK